MRIIEDNVKKGYIKLIPENPDDLWILYNIIKPGDLVTAPTTREIKGDKGSSSRRIPMKLTIRVKTMEFQPFTERLRIRGIVVEGPDKFGVKGHYHTLNIEIGTPLTIYKDEWSEYYLKRLREATTPRGRILLVALDYDEAVITLLGEQGVKTLYEETAHIPGKNEPQQYESSLKRYLEELTSRIAELIDKYDPGVVVVASPGGLAKEVYGMLKEKKPHVSIIVDHVSMGGSAGVKELLRRDSVRNALRDLSLVKASRILEEFRRRLIKEPDMIAYGIDEVLEAVQANAVDKLVVVEDHLRSYDEEYRRRIEELLDEAYKRRAEIVIVPSKTDVAEEANAFTGIIALLRYPFKRFI